MEKPAKLELKREELYEWVWSTSMVKLSAKLGLSNSGLAKICDAMEVPHPSNGYWAKFRAGKAPPRTGLPPLTEKGVSRYIVKLKYALPLKGVERVSVDLVPEHELVQLSRREIDSKVWNNDKVTCMVLGINVSGHHVERALGVFNFLLKSLESVGEVIHFSEPKPGNWRVTVQLDKEFGTLRVWDEYSYYGGSLVVDLDHSWQSGGTRFKTRWRDLKNRPVESRLWEVIDAVVHIKNRVQDERVEREEQDRINAEKARVHSERKNLYATLTLQSRYRQEAQRLRAYLDEVIEAGEARLESDEYSQLTAWADQARKLVDELDPITGNWVDGRPPNFVDSLSSSPYLYGQNPSPSYAPWWFVKHAKGWK